MNRKILSLALLCTALSANAQVTENSAWMMYFGTVKLAPHFGIQADVHLRSGDDYSYLRQAMVRPGLSWLIKPTQTASAGFSIVSVNRNLDGVSNNILRETGAWEQFIQAHRPGRFAGFHRVRLEQRFNEQAAGNTVFSQRFRYMFRYLYPLKKPAGAFTSGAFISLQNELMFHVQHKDRLNGSLFDQHRAMGGLGLRFSPKADIELAYLRQYVNGRVANTTNHVAQLAIYNRF